MDMIEKNNMFSVELEPWHKKGIILDNPPTSAEAIVAAGMDWNVDKRQLYYEKPQNDIVPALLFRRKFEPAEKRFGLFRETDNKLFGVVSDAYQVVQNTESFEFFDPMVREGMASYETAGVLTDGRVWILARIHGDMVIGDDDIRKYLMMLNDHSGSGSVILQPTAVRAVCHNTITQSLKTGMVYKHQHRKGVVQKLQNTKHEILGLVESFRGMERDLQQFSEVKLDDAALEKFFHAVADVDLSQTDGDQDEKVDRATRNKLKAVHVMQTMHDNGLGATYKTRGTVYGAYNAAIEFVDWRMGSRSKDRTRYQLSGAGAHMKTRAYEEAMALAS